MVLHLHFRTYLLPLGLLLLQRLSSSVWCNYTSYLSGTYIDNFFDVLLHLSFAIACIPFLDYCLPLQWHGALVHVDIYLPAVLLLRPSLDGCRIKHLLELYLYLPQRFISSPPVCTVLTLFTFVSNHNKDYTI